MGGYSPSNPGGMKNIDYVTIQSEGKAVDFGDAATGSHGKYSHAGFSNGHGGL